MQSLVSPSRMEHSPKVQAVQGSPSLHADLANQQYPEFQPDPEDLRDLQNPAELGRKVEFDSGHQTKEAGDSKCGQGSSQGGRLLQALPSLPAGQGLHGAQRLPAFPEVQRHLEHPLVRLCQQSQRDQKRRGYPVKQKVGLYFNA